MRVQEGPGNNISFPEQPATVISERERRLGRTIIRTK